MKPAPDLHPLVTIEFDGKEFKAVENGKVIKNWPAVLGRPGYQGAEHQGDKDNGPLPEGEWVLRQDNYQKIGPRDAVLGVIKPGKHGAWPGSVPVWGTERVWLEPSKGTDTKGRDNFSVHGGWQPGSAGCVDLTGKMGEFAGYFRNLGKDVTVRVRYNR
ncbi:L,D-transpeptidase family protein [Magnetospirillum molischianum]|uniref:L,D-TPase catalytic domain-containing protein n=1 Tax=Magnetospirillum molischianum DSM 120 TaxID=1150626 RepID=H8FQP8_MAGML|nr:L,D-transpeptidase family protein [Magnetospirillum molischianum]CCG40686.1 hypothetical protein PHAMO_210197 [Magnetospirillum molischianum DSM 120]